MSSPADLKERTSAMLEFKKTLWRGLVITLPIGIAVWIGYGILNVVNGLGEIVLNPFLSDRDLVWGMGLLLVLCFILVIGRLEIYYDGKPGNAWQTAKDRTIGRIPLFGSFFSSSKKIISLEDLRKLSPCKFWLSDTTPHYGFIINQQKVRGADTEIDVYRPNVPTIIPGDLFPLKKRLVIKLANPASEILDKLASGGFISSEEEIPVPWEGETAEDFHERINLTPLEIAVKRIIGERAKDLSQRAG